MASLTVIVSRQDSNRWSDSSIHPSSAGRSCHPISALRESPMLRLENAQADIKSFTITLNHSAGTKRGLGRGSFVSSVTSLVDQFYVDVLQYLKNWAAAAPRPKDSPPGAAQEVDPPVSTDIQTSQASDRDVLARQTCSEGRAAGSLNLAHSWMTTDGHRRSIVIAVVE